MIKALFTGGLIVFLTVWANAAVPDLPYNPSYIWAPAAENGSLAYVLLPESPNSSRLKLQALNLSAGFDTSAAFVDVPNQPAFLYDDGVKSIVPVPNNEGLPRFYVGDCRSNSAELWRFVPESKPPGVSGTWSNSLLNQGDGAEGVLLAGPNYLSTAITFPDGEEDHFSNTYVFGGMCPKSADPGGQTWVSNANYSRAIVSLRPVDSLKDNSYEQSISPIRSSPIEQAGSSLTPLLPAHFNSSSGKELRQQSFVLLGGHTRDAFINMSQIALFSLPESSWSYVSTEVPSGLKNQGNQAIEPRSGHTAVLTPDGDKLIILGGWVGDVTYPAQPQLAILELGDDYGGSGDWTWTVPQIAGNGLSDGTGIFGHGAAMLSGGVMAVVGGYEIPKPSKRATLKPRDTSQMYLFNITSQSWITSYAPPRKAGSSKDSSGPLSTTAQKAGLGVGLGVGLSAALAGLVLLITLRTRHRRAHKRVREQELRKLALGAERPHLSIDEIPGALYQPMVQVKRDFNPGDPSHGNRNDWNDNYASLAEKTGLLIESPSPTRGLRRAMHSGTYQPTTYPEDPRRPLAFSSIHPIEEREEDEQNMGDLATFASGQGKRDSKNSVLSDPFKDPPSPVKASFWPPIIPLRFGNKGKMEENYDANDEDMFGKVHGHRTQQLEKTDRTLSNLSESSGSSMSNVSYRTNSLGFNQQVLRMSAYQSLQQFDTGGEPSRSLPLANQEQEFPPLHMPTDDLTFIPQYVERTYPFEDHGRPERGSLLDPGPSSLLPSKPNDHPVQNKSRAMEWVGSVRRALSLARKSETGWVDSAGSETTVRPLERSLSSSPTKSFHSAREIASSGSDASVRPPRRAVSTNSSVLRRKQGAKDWDVKPSSAERSTLLRRETYDGVSPLDGGHSSGLTRVGGRDITSPDLLNDYIDDDEDWDVEAAAEGREVQVTFTVPKDRLRVVNAGDDDGLDDDDDDDDNNNNNDSNDDHDDALDDDNNGHNKATQHAKHDVVDEDS